TIMTGPPSAETRLSGPVGMGAKTMTPLTPHVPPRPSGAAHKTSGAPPASETFLSLPWEKNAMLRLLGDQKGDCAPSVPWIARASRDPRGRTQIRTFRAESMAANASVRPSGEMQALVGSGSRVIPGGTETENVVTGGGRRCASQAETVSPIAAVA